MKFEDLVKEYKDTKFQIKRIDLKINELKQLYGYPASSNYDGQPTSRSTNSSVENTIIRLDELTQERNRFEQILANLRAKMQALIDTLNNYAMREIIELKIFSSNNCGWKYISSKVYLSKSYCRRLFHDGITLIDENKT